MRLRPSVGLRFALEDQLGVDINSGTDRVSGPGGPTELFTERKQDIAIVLWSMVVEHHLSHFALVVSYEKGAGEALPLLRAFSSSLRHMEESSVVRESAQLEAHTPALV